MRQLTGYIVSYFLSVEKRLLASCTLFVAVLIFINYYHGLNIMISTRSESGQYLSWLLVFLTSFSFGYIMLAIFVKKKIFSNWKFIVLLFLGPAIFAWKMCYDIELNLSDNELLNAYWNAVVYWPLKLLGVAAMLFLVWFFFDRQQPYYGVSLKKFKPAPYLLMLVIMIPLIAAASTQQDFLMMYPKLQNIQYLSESSGKGYYQLMYEISYGIDFITIELFFRGFLVLAFAKWAGKDAILPMACFYCTIHFGKPLGECISSYFGGMLLGVVIFHTRTIIGGLMVHVGIAWLMELGGYLGKW